MGTSEENPSEYNWLDKMKGYLIWTVRGPDLHNPFLPAIPDHVLVSMLDKPELLNEYIELKCSCDGHEVLTLKNLNKPVIRAEHPCVKSLKNPDIITAINRLGILESMASELLKIQRSVLDEVRTRQKNKKTVSADVSGKTLGEIKKDNKEIKKLQDVKLNSSVLTAPNLNIKNNQ